MKKINLVMSTYNDEQLFEQFSYMVDYENTEVFFYKKRDDLSAGEKRQNGIFIEIPNYGSCDYAFFNYIVDNYENLADVNIFTKLTTDFPNRHEVFQNCKDYDFYECGSYNVSQIWYDGEKHDISNFKTKYTNVDKHDIRQTKYNRGELTGYVGDGDFGVDWFNLLYGQNIETPLEICTYGHGPCFSVSKELIRRHSKETYQYFIDMFHPFNSWNQEAGERHWKTNSVKEQTHEIGRHYHDQLCRFYRTLFTYGVNDDYKINQV
jgi:hypothetical protein